MSQSALRRAVWVSLAFVLAGAFSGGAVRFVSAMFIAQTTNSNSQWGDSWLGPATNLAASYSANNVTVTWTPGGSPLVTSQKLYGYLLSPQPTDAARSGNDLSVTNGSATITSATANWSSNDVGKSIVIGTTGYTIGGVASSTSASLTVNYAGSTANGVTWYLATGICPAAGSASYATTIGTYANDTTATQTDNNRASGNNGSIYCYELAGSSTMYSTWTAYARLVAQPGFAATRILFANSSGGTSGSINANDTITITWNQRPKIANGTLSVCTFANGTILLGDTVCSLSTEAFTAAKLSSTGSIGASTIKWGSSTVSSTTSAPFTSTITLAGSASVPSTSQRTWTLTPATALQSNASTTVTACTTSPYCTPTTTSNF